MVTIKVPATLLEAVRYFSDPDVCLNFFSKLRWPDGIAVCPRCESKQTYFLSTRRIWKCKGCAKQFSVKSARFLKIARLVLTSGCLRSGSLQTRRMAQVHGRSTAISAVTQKSAWFMAHRIRFAMQTGSFEKKTLWPDRSRRILHWR